MYHRVPFVTISVTQETRTFLIKPFNVIIDTVGKPLARALTRGDTLRLLNMAYILYFYRTNCKVFKTLDPPGGERCGMVTQRSYFFQGVGQLNKVSKILELSEHFSNRDPSDSKYHLDQGN